MDISDYLSVLRRRWVTLVATALAVLALASAVTLTSTPRYTAAAQLFFGVEGSGSATELAQGSSFAEKQMSSYARVATSPLVLRPVISDLRLGTTPAQLATSITATVPSDTVILEIAVTRRSPEQAAAIANAVASELAEVAAQLAPARADGSQAVRATTVAPAAAPLAPSSPDILRNLVLGALLGLLLGLGLVMLRHVLDTKVRSEADVRAISDSSVVGVIAFDDGVPAHPVILREDPRSAAAEAVRRLRTNLQFIGVAEQTRSIVVTSSVPGEGKSTTALNLGVALADAGARVLLVDADLRRPSIAEYLGLEGRVGLTTVLIGKASVEEVVQPWSDSGLDILPAGQIPPNPSELLGSPAMRALLDQLTSTYDMVLIDTPPVLPVTDAAVLGRQVGGSLLVVGVDRIHRPQLREALDSLATAGCPVLGLVINKIAHREVGAYVYERGYYSSTADDGPGVGSASSPAATGPTVAGPSEPAAAEKLPAARV